MAVYVASTGTPASPYDTWATATDSIFTAVSVAGGADIIVDKEFNQAIGEVAVVMVSSGRIIVVDRTAGDTPAQQVGTLSSPGAIGFYQSSNLKVYAYGLSFASNTANNNKKITIGYSENGHFVAENCKFKLGTGIGSYLELGKSGGDRNPSYVKLINPTLEFGHADQGIRVQSFTEISDVVYSSGSVNTNNIINNAVDNSTPRYSNATVIVRNTKVEKVTSAIIGDCYRPGLIATFENCNFPSGIPLLATQTIKNLSAADVTAYNCGIGDQHYQIAKANAFGSMSVDTSIYKTAPHSWAIASTGDCTIFAPFVSPWIDLWHTGTSAITPTVEILRNDSTSALNDDEVWVEYSYQGTSASSKGATVNSKVTLLGTPDPIPAGAGLAAWTGEGGTAWSGKLVSPSITPLNPGTIRARVCIGKPNQTIYVNPVIDI